MNWAAILWLVLTVLFLIAEASTVTLVSLWFAAGSLVALLVSALGGAPWLQITVFLAVSVVTLLLLRPISRNYLTPRLTKTNIDSVVGSTGLVTADINNVTAEGQVKLGAMYWTARSTSGAPIPRDVLVKVDRIEGVKVFVSPVLVPTNL